jgi:hypothetical protein
MKMDEQASLFEAAMSSSIKDSVYKKPIMKLLLDHGADVNHKSLNGKRVSFLRRDRTTRIWWNI